MHWLAEYGLFFAKTLTWVIAVLIIVAGVAAIFSKGKSVAKGKIVIKKLNDKYREMAHALQEKLLSKKEYKNLCKAEEKADKEEEKNKEDKRRVFVLDFHGDIRATAVNALSEEISAILSVAKSTDEVVVRLESGGGLVNTYGLAASQLDRLKQHNIPLTIAVDKVAASGGYLMACVANKIVSAPFAIIGSIGVLAQMPNFHRWLKDKHIDFEQQSAGEYKRTVTMFGENTKKDREKLQADLEEIHHLFKAFLMEHRPQLDINKVSTGEHWLGTRAFELKLVDELMTSDDYLIKASKGKVVFLVKYEDKKSLGKKLSYCMQLAADKLGFTSYYG